MSALDDFELPERECLRCGTVLEKDEGICPTCGTEYGRQTVALPAIDREAIQAASAAMKQQQQASPSLDGGMVPMGQEQGSNKTLWIVAGAMALIAVVLIVVTIVVATGG